VALVGIDVSDDRNASIRVKRIRELGTNVSSNDQLKHAAKKYSGDTFLRNVGSHRSYMASHPKYRILGLRVFEKRVLKKYL
jgi:hypothetical protein